MVTTTVSAAGWATSMFPAPVCVKPPREGVTCACRAPSVMETLGGGGCADVTVIVTGVPGGTVVACPAAAESGYRVLRSKTIEISKFLFMGRMPPWRYH